MSLSVDPTAWNVRKARVEREVSGWSAGVARDLAGAVGMHVVAMAPVDTGRYVRAVAQAVNFAGGGPIPVRTVTPSRHHAKYVGALKRQVDAWERYAKWRRERLNYLYPGGSPRRGRTAFYRGLAAQVRMAEKRERRAREELAKALTNDDALFVGLLHSGRSVDGRLATVRTKVYGGVGIVVETPRGAEARLTVLEPHARFLERRLRLFARAKRSTLAQRVLALAERELRRVVA